MQAMQGSTWRGHAIGVVVAAVAFAGTVAIADTICVPDDYDTIQEAIDAAMDGDEVCVAPGTYNEAIDLLGKAVRVYGTDGPEVTTIDATGLERSVVTCTRGEDLDTVLEGFTITGGIATNGGGMYVASASPTVRGCVFRENTAFSLSGAGGGLYCSNSSAEIVGCQFIRNAAEAPSPSGGGERVSGNVSFTDCVFDRNTANGDCSGSGGGLSGSNVTVRRCEFLRNRAGGGSCAGFGSGHGGGAALSSSTVTGCTFVANSASGYGSNATGSGSGGGLYGADLHVINSRFSGNVARGASPDGFASAGGGGLHVTRSVIVACLITENRASVGGSPYPWGRALGGGVYVTGEDEDDYSELIGVLVARNSAEGEEGYDSLGGGIYVDVACSTFYRMTGAMCQNTPDSYCDDCIGCLPTNPECPPCPGDVNDDFVVDLEDIIAILAAWGETGGPGDLDGSGAVDFGDVIIVLRTWGRPCLGERGACCFVDGGCVDGQLEAECASQDGLYRGNGSACAIDCRTGACCFEDGTCNDPLLPEACANMAGTYQGDGTTCAMGCGLGSCGLLIQAPIDWEDNLCGEPDGCPLRAGPDLRWEVTIPEDGAWRFATCSATRTVITVDTANCCGDEYRYEGLCGFVTLDDLVAGQVVFVTLEAADGCGPVRVLIDGPL